MFAASTRLLLMILIAFRCAPGQSLRIGAGASTRRCFRLASTGGRTSAAVTQDADKGKKGETKEALSLQPPKGTRDFYPEDHRQKDWLFSSWRSVARRYGFEEYDAPVLENEELYIRKAGEEVTQQLYNFEDKGGRRLSLRPEMTPSLARMVLAKKGALPFPLKWFAIPQCWRYERMTRGRRREHYQWNMDIWGVEGVEAEVELLSAITTSFKDLGITAEDVGIKINSRKILNGLMEKVGIPEEKWIETCVLVDKLEKVPVSSLREDLDKVGVTEASIEELLGALKMKTIEEFEEVLGSSDEGVVDLKNIFKLADDYGIRDWLQFDPSVVRGLAYYTGVVFEGFDRSGELRAICGGGRYDGLLSSLSGGKETAPAVGFGFGDAVIVELLKMKNLLPDFSRNCAIDSVIYVMPQQEEDTAVADAMSMKAKKLANELRAANKSVYMVMDSRKPKWVFQKADKLGAGTVIMIASDEHVNNEATVKTLDSGEQSKVQYEDIVKTLVGRS